VGVDVLTGWLLGYPRALAGVRNTGTLMFTIQNIILNRFINNIGKGNYLIQITE
jgi:hypothetical protein